MGPCAHSRSAGWPRDEHGQRRARKGHGRRTGLPFVIPACSPLGLLPWTRRSCAAPSSTVASWQVPVSPSSVTRVPSQEAFPQARHQPGQLPGETAQQRGAACGWPAPCGSVNVPTVSGLQAHPLHGALRLSREAWAAS